MGAIVIGIGAALAAIGIVLGAIGFGSVETTSGAGLMTAGSTGFVGGLLVVALGFILRVLSDIAEKLDGAVHFESFEDEAHAGRVEASGTTLVEEPFVPAAPPHTEAPRPASAHASPAAREPLELAAEDDERELPTWFSRKRVGEPPAGVEPAFAPEPEFEPEPDFELPPFRSPLPEPVRQDTVRSEPARIEPVRTEPLRADPLRSEPLRPEPARREPPPSFLRPGGAGGGAPTERPAPAVSDEEIRAPRLREEFTPEPDDAPPAFLREADLLSDEPEPAPAAPGVTVLKSGTIGGMSYKLYSDGSIEADLPDGMLRFASLQELRDHVASGASRE